jgi:hypothetical protein
MLYYDEQSWKKLNERKSPDEIKKIMSRAIISKKIPFPYEDISPEQCNSDFDLLLRYEYNDGVSKTKWNSKFDYPGVKKLNTCLLRSNLGKKVSNRFTQVHRYNVDHREIKSGPKAWSEPESHNSMLTPLWSISNVKSVTPDTLRRAIAMRKYLAGQFRPTSARAIYEGFGGGNVLDFSAGWGDRLVGAMASPSVKSYLGIDPNPALHPCYKRILDSQKTSLANPKLKVETIIGCAEDVNYGRRKFNIIFTSPPYFNVEKYHGEKSSWRGCKTQDCWLKNFLMPALANGWRHLERGGFMLINISDIQNRGRQLICKPMVDFVERELGGKCIGYMGYEMSKFIGQRLANRPEGIYGEPIFVFVK